MDETTAVPLTSWADPALPALGSGDPQLIQRLRAAQQAKGSGYRARARHLSDAGAPKYVNRLICETSPYLLQHAHNPVNWYPWGDEAFVRAAQQDKPVLLSIGYATCHWCHVMERESFEDEEIAACINAHYVAIKVDREERPDVDNTYMLAVQMLTGSGGWPMTVVLTPSRRPFFAGTYFPARDGDRGVREGFLTILLGLKEAYGRAKERIVEQAQAIGEHMRAATAMAPPGNIPGPEVIAHAAQALARAYDPVWGGFGGAPKFPTPVHLELMLRYAERTADERVGEMVAHTLRQMAAGGIYDHVGGGFHRYATDARWRVPHFEKMLYDNAQLASVYLDGAVALGEPDFARVAKETLDYVLREMTSEDGGFYAALDADSLTPEGLEEEGWFFTWTPAEIRQVLGEEDARWVTATYDVSDAGNFAGRNVLHTPRSRREVAASLGLGEQALTAAIARARDLLYVARRRRPAPLRDDKILTSCNGLMISALAKGAFVLQRPDYAHAAARAARFVLSHLRTATGRLLRCSVAGEARHNAYLDDHAFLIQGLLDLYEATFELRWLGDAMALQEVLDAHHADASGGYFRTSDDHEELLLRDKPSHDGAEPAGNSVALLNLLRLHSLTGAEPYLQRAEAGFAAFSTQLTRSGLGHTKMLSALDRYCDGPRDVVIVTAGANIDAEPLVGRVRRAFLPNRALHVAVAGDDLHQKAALCAPLRDKTVLHAEMTAYVCERGRCAAPTDDPVILAEQLTKTTLPRSGP